MRNVWKIAMVAALAAAGHAEVADSSASGFTVKTTMMIAAPPEEVYRKLVRNVGDWWSKDHTFSGDSRNLSIEEKPGGCFCEKLPAGGGARHMEVVRFEVGKVLVMSGALGPMQTMAAAGNMQFQLAGVNGGTSLVFTYAVNGYLANGMNALAVPVNVVLTEQLTRLKNFVERGDPAAQGDKQP